MGNIVAVIAKILIKNQIIMCKLKIGSIDRWNFICLNIIMLYYI